MASLLDGILDGMTAPATVVSENHDASSINWVNGMSDPGEMISCGYLPQARRQQGESDGEYAKRIQVIIDALPAHEREKIMTRGRTAAINRASLDTTNGKVNAMFAGKAPWHGLGVLLDKQATSAEAIKFAGLDWNVLRVPLTYCFQAETKFADGAFGLIRSDTGACLGTVGSKYNPVQNVDGFAAVDSVLEEFGARYESAGSLYGGRSVWMLAAMPKQSFQVNGDEMSTYALFSNPHDGSGCGWFVPTTLRAECANTVRLALAGAKGKGMRFRHTGSIKDKVRDAQRALGLAVRSVDTFREHAETLVKKPCDINHYASDVLDVVLDVTAAQAKLGASALAAALDVTEANRELAEKSFASKIERRGEILEDILSRYESGRCHPLGTVWAAFNSITEHADHNTLGRKASDEVTRMSRRFESTLGGDRDELKQVAYAQALAL